MNTTINQFRVEFETYAAAHAQINSFRWMDLVRATSETEIKYPLMYTFHNNIVLNRRNNTLTLVIGFADRVYDGLENLNDTDSDTAQLCRDMVNMMRRAPRWQRLGRVESATAPKFFENSNDQVCGHEMTVIFALRASESICDIPVFGYDTEGSFQPQCAPVTITDSDGTTVVEVAAGSSFSCTPVADVTISNSDDSYQTTASPGDDVQLPDITVTTGDGDLTFPSVVDIDLSTYREIILPTGTRTPVNTVTNPSTQIAWIGSVNTATGSGTIEKTSGGSAWNADANFVIPTIGNFGLSFIVSGFAMVGFSVYDINASFETIGFALYRYSGGYIIYESGAVQFSTIDATSYTMRIDFVDEEVRYYINNALVHTSTVPAAPFTHGYMTFDCSILNVGDKIENILLTFL